MKPIQPKHFLFSIVIHILLIATAMLFLPHIAYGESVTAPETFFGFTPGADRMLISYDRLVAYLMQADRESECVKMEEAGVTAQGKKMYLVFVSSAENIRNLDKLRNINRQLALDPAIPDAERVRLVEEGRVFCICTLSMHSTEVGPTQAVPTIVHRLVANPDGETRSWLDRVVYMFFPCHNPDGMDSVIDYYQKYKGTKYEGSSMPGVYGKYVGHDINRDFITLTQEDNRIVSRVFSHTWFPQVMAEKHQMGGTEVRYFIPPNHDPIAQVIDADLWNWNGVFGANMLLDMTSSGLSGIAYNYAFDNYWPGSTETCLWKNVISFLTEASSAKVATPIFVEPTELEVDGKGLSDYKKSINFPLPWPGGWWRLGDIVQYEISSTMSILKTAARNHKEILTFRNELCRREVRRGASEAPFFYVLPQKQHDPGEWLHIINLMRDHGVRVYRLSGDARIGGIPFLAGDAVIPMSQPFRPFIKEVLETQTYPVRRYTPGGEIIDPYDITSWSLPLHRGVSAVEITAVTPADSGLEDLLTPISDPLTLKDSLPADTRALLFPANRNESFKAAFIAAAAGFTTERSEERLKINDMELPAGSFIVHGGVKEWQTLAPQLTVNPIPLSQFPTVKTRKFTAPRIALVETFFHDMDSGWTRYVFDTFRIPYRILRPGDFAQTDLAKTFDVIIIPDSDPNILKEGKNKREDHYYPVNYPPEFIKGIENEGLEKLLRFIHNGGVVIAWGRSTGLFSGELTLTPEKKGDAKEFFRLPITEISDDLKKEGLYCPGSLLNIRLLPQHPLTWGMPDQTGIFSRGRPVFKTSIPALDMDRRVIGWFPEKDILASGYAKNVEKLAQRAAMVWLKKNKGQLVLMGFNPQFRASTAATYKLLFNALLLPL